MKKPIAKLAIATLLSSTALTFTPGGVALAQDTEADDQDGDQIIVTARRREERIQDVPDSIVAFDAETLLQAGVDDFVDLFLLTPNVNFQQSFRPGQTYLTVRGIPTAQGGEAPVAIVIDGVQQPSFEWMNPKLLNIKSIELIKGPQGALYGRGAIAGAIIINTKEATNDYKARIRAGYANGDDLTLDANVSGPLVKDKVLFDVVANYRNYDGVILDAAGRGNDQEESYTVQGRLRVLPTENWEIDFTGRYTDIEGGAQTVERHTTADVFNLDVLGSAEPPVDQATTYEQWTARSVTDFDFGELTAVFGYHETANERTGDADFTPADFLLADQLIIEETYNAEVRLTSPNEQAFRWAVGGFWQDRDSNDTLRVFTSSTFPGGPMLPPPNFDLLNSNEIELSNSWAVYGQANYDVFDNLELTFALRYDEDKRQSEDTLVAGSFIENTFTALQPKASLGYNITPDILAYASYGRGFRSGGFNAFADVQNNPAIAREYPKEISNNVELGLKTTFADGRLTLNGAVFRIDFDNQQYFFIEVTNIVARSIVSIDNTVIKGFELESSWSPTDNLSFAVGLGVLDTEIKDFPAQPAFVGNRAPFSQNLSINLSAQHTLPLSRDWEIVSRVDYEHLGDLFFGLENDFLFPSINYLNMRLTLRNDRISVGAFTKNLLDEQTTSVFFPNSFAPGVHARTRNLPRQFGGFIELNF